MREESLPLAIVRDSPRITPAHAGRMRQSCRCRINASDHPRACGKNAISACCGPHPEGSPPRMREEFKRIIYRKAHCRITPAHAGRIHIHDRQTRGGRDHPRACGKNTKKFHKYSYSLPITSINLFTFIDN